MDLTDEQWAVVEPLIPEEERNLSRKRGRPWRDCREVLNGILWVLRTGAPWKDLPDRYPPYQTCHRRFQRWVRMGVMEAILRALVEDLKARGGLDLEECFIDGTFVVAKKGAMGWEGPDGAGLPIAVCVTSASPHEVTLVEPTQAACFAPGMPGRLIGEALVKNIVSGARI